MLLCPSVCPSSCSCWVRNQFCSGTIHIQHLALTLQLLGTLPQYAKVELLGETTKKFLQVTAGPETDPSTAWWILEWEGPQPCMSQPFPQQGADSAHLLLTALNPHALLVINYLQLSSLSDGLELQPCT